MTSISSGFSYAHRVTATLPSSWLGRALRGRVPLTVVVLACVAAVAAAVTAVVAPATGLRFVQDGHWVAQPESDLVVHVDGGARTVDARMRVPGIEPGSSVVHGETSGYVVGRSRIIEFGKSTLTVERTVPAPAAEQPVAVETPGGPYLVYRRTGMVVRLGPEYATVPVPGPLGDPVATPDGTLWVHRLDSGVLCRLPRNASQVTCPAVAPRGHAGALTVVGSRAAFVDTTADTVHAVSADGLGPSVPIPADLPDTARLAPRDAAGRLAILDDDTDRMLLVDAAELDPRRAPSAPVTVPLPRADFERPAVSGEAVVMLDRTHATVRTYAADGTPLHQAELPEEQGDPRLAMAEDGRVYIEGALGRHVLVIDHDGAVNSVAVGGDEETTSRQLPESPERSTPDREPDSPDDGGRDVRVDSGSGGGEPRPNPQPPPDPAGPPGLPPGLSARADVDTVTVTWGSAQSNGAPVTAYHVTWSAPSESRKSKTVSGDARSTVLSGLSYDTTYTITVRAENRVGRGAPATTSVTVERVPVVTVTRGTTEGYDGCEVPDCAKMRVVLRNFEPNTEYHIVPYSSNPYYSNEGSSQTTDDNGYVSFEAFHYEGIGDTVWVVVDDRWESNRYVWEAEK